MLLCCTPDLYQLHRRLVQQHHPEDVVNNDAVTECNLSIVEILYVARKAGYAIQEVPVTWINSPNSRVHILTDSVRMFFDFWRIRFNDLTGCYTSEEKERNS
jgi:hypothetical protein